MSEEEHTSQVNTENATPVTDPSELPSSSETFVTSLQENLNEVIEKLTKYIRHEVEGSVEEYLLLEKLNVAAAKYYEGLSTQAERLTCLLDEVKVQASKLQPYLTEIDNMYESAIISEKSLQELDQLTLDMEKQLQRIYQ